MAYAASDLRFLRFSCGALWSGRSQVQYYSHLVTAGTEVGTNNHHYFSQYYSVDLYEINVPLDCNYFFFILSTSVSEMRKLMEYVFNEIVGEWWIDYAGNTTFKKS
jgi:hypothetical protein